VTARPLIRRVRGLRRGGALLAAGALVTAGLAACSSASSTRPGDVLDAVEAQQKADAAVAAPPAAAAAAAAPASCSPKPNVSYDPLGSVPSTLPAGSLEATIRNRGSLVVGVAGDTRLLGARDRLTEAAPKGFDIEIAKALGRAIFGSDGHVTFKVITAGQRFPQVNAGADKQGVDVVARAVSMTCDRWAATDPAKGSAFSAAYLSSDQRFLVRKGVPQINSVDDLVAQKRATDPSAQVKICAPVGSTSLAKITGWRPEVTPVAVAIHSDCLALWQEGRVDAITGDDVILAGFKDQDPTAVILGGQALDNTPYGLAISKAHPEFVQYVNAVMATSQFRQDWQRAYDTYLAPALGDAAKKSFPPPTYGRPLP